MNMSYLIWLDFVAMVSIIIMITDICDYWIPDEAVFALIIAIGAASFCGFIQPDPLACIVVIYFFLFCYYLYPKGMGSGDIKLVTALSLGCTIPEAIMMVYIAFFTALIAAVLSWKFNQSKMIPFGPFIIIGWWCSYLWGDVMLKWITFI